MTENLLNLEERLRRKMSRPARTQSVATRFTKDEELELLKAAEKEGEKAVEKMFLESLKGKKEGDEKEKKGKKEGDEKEKKASGEKDGRRC